jgi:hypothetical protein
MATLDIADLPPGVIVTFCRLAMPVWMPLNDPRVLVMLWLVV